MLQILIIKFDMRVYLHLKGFRYSKINSQQQLKLLQKSQKKMGRFSIIFSVKVITTSDELLLIVANRLNIKSQEMILKIVVKHRNQYRKLIVTKGFNYSCYSSVLGDNPSTLNYQVELQATFIGQNGIKQDLDDTGDCSNIAASQQGNDLSENFNSHQIFHYSNQLFQYLKIDQLGLFVNLIDLFIKKHTRAELQIMINLYQYQTGFTILLAAIYYNKNQLLQNLLLRYGSFIDFNMKSIDGWLPFQLAINSQNKKAMNLFIEYSSKINLDINCVSQHGQIIFNLINTINLDLIQNIVRRFPIKFQDHHQEHRLNVYDYVWNHHRLTQNQKKHLLNLMHSRHLQMYDCYRWDQLLYNSCVRYLPEAPRRYSPKKQIIYNPNLKIISGQIIKCKNPALFSKYVFFSVNSYAGAIEQYEINSKLKINNDKDKLDRYQKKYHLSFEQIQSVQVIDQKDKNWFLKKQWYCFSIKEKRDNKIIFACNHQYTANQWANQIKQAIDAWAKNQYKHYSNKISKNYIHISDVQYKPPQNNAKKFGATKLIELFSNRLSVCEPETSHNQPSLQKQMPMIKSKSHYNTININNQIASQQMIENPTSFKFKDFKMMRLLGQGSFGQVYLVECLKNKKFYALKAFQKKKIILSKQTKFVVSQVNILKQIKHPFIITLYFTFQTPNYIYLGLQYCEGQDLARHMNQQMMFPEEDVKIYAAQITLAIQYLHSIGIIYRDLKPQNIMLGKDGHILLVDFGLSKKTQNNFAKTFCGSPAYLSPEMLDKQGVGPQSDYFTLGVVIYQFIFGEPPFFSDNIHLLYQNIQNGKIKYPRKIDDVTKNFLESLLQKDPKVRLGSRSIQDIKNHEYFSGIDWQKIYKKQFKAPSRQLHNSQFQIEEPELINIFHDDFDYSVENYKINRFKNFSFVREEEFN